MLVMFAFIGFVYLASRFPLFGSIGGGLLFLGSPVVAWLLYNPKFFQTDGSPAGMVLMLIFAVIIVVMMTLGLSMIKAALFPAPKLSADERADLAMDLMNDRHR